MPGLPGGQVLPSLRRLCHTLSGMPVKHGVRKLWLHLVPEVPVGIWVPAMLLQLPKPLYLPKLPELPCRWYPSGVFRLLQLQQLSVPRTLFSSLLGSMHNIRALVLTTAMCTAH